MAFDRKPYFKTSGVVVLAAVAVTSIAFAPRAFMARASEEYLDRLPVLSAELENYFKASPCGHDDGQWNSRRMQSIRESLASNWSELPDSREEALFEFVRRKLIDPRSSISPSCVPDLIALAPSERWLPLVRSQLTNVRDESSGAALALVIDQLVYEPISGNARKLPKSVANELIQLLRPGVVSFRMGTSILERLDGPFLVSENLRWSAQLGDPLAIEYLGGSAKVLLESSNDKLEDWAVTSAAESIRILSELQRLSSKNAARRLFWLKSVSCRDSVDYLSRDLVRKNIPQALRRCKKRY